MRRGDGRTPQRPKNRASISANATKPAQRAISACPPPPPLTSPSDLGVGIKSKKTCSGYRPKSQLSRKYDRTNEGASRDAPPALQSSSTSDADSQESSDGDRQLARRGEHSSLTLRSGGHSSDLAYKHDWTNWQSANYAVKPLRLLPAHASVEDVVFAYFKDNFFTPDPSGGSPHLTGTQDCNAALNQAIISLSTLTLANNHGSFDDVTRARHHYGVALRCADASLRDPTQAVHDDTLSAILLLCIFECIDCWDSRSLDQWANHIRGAFQIVLMRERAFKPDQKPRSLFFFRIRSLFTIICLFRGVAVPIAADEWAHEYDKYDTKVLPGLLMTNPYQRVVMKLADDLCRIQETLRRVKDSNPYEILAKLREIQRVLMTVANPSLEEDFLVQPAIDQKQEPHVTWEGVYHVYPSHYAYMSLYHWRNVALFLGTLLSKFMTKCGKGLLSFDQMEVMRERMQLVDDILWGLAWRLGERKISPAGFAFAMGSAPPIMWGFTSMWALVFACEAICHDTSFLFFHSTNEECQQMKERASRQLQWARGKLRHIDSLSGIRQAAVFADHFQERWESHFIDENPYPTP